MPTARNLALLSGRLVLGGYLAAHGAQKLFGSFDGYGIEATSGGSTTWDSSRAPCCRLASPASPRSEGAHSSHSEQVTRWVR